MTEQRPNYSGGQALPETDQGLDALVQRPQDSMLAKRWNGPHTQAVHKDPWGNGLKYENIATADESGPRFRVWPLGPDGQDGTEGDIRSQSEWSSKSAGDELQLDLRAARG